MQRYMHKDIHHYTVYHNRTRKRLSVHQQRGCMHDIAIQWNAVQYFRGQHKYIFTDLKRCW